MNSEGGEGGSRMNVLSGAGRASMMNDYSTPRSPSASGSTAPS